MKGYKGFDKDLKCRDFQYEVGKTYECKGGVVLCENGFHFCEDPKNIRGYYADLTTCRYCEVEASGKIINGDGKCVCSKITIVREIPLQEFLALVNEGSRNTGWARATRTRATRTRATRTRATRTRATRTRATGTRATGTRATATRATATRATRTRATRTRARQQGQLQQGRRQRGQLQRGRCEHRFIQSRKRPLRPVQHRWRMRHFQQIHPNQAHRH
jgi:hypothetical protein